MMKGASKTRFSGKEVANSPAKARSLGSSTRLLEGRQAHAGQKRSYEMGRRGFIRKLFTGVTVLTVGLGAPSILGAGEKRVAKASAQAEPETVVTLEELQPYFNTAKPYIIPLSSGTKVNDWGAKGREKLYVTQEYQLVVEESKGGVRVDVLKSNLKGDRLLAMATGKNLPGRVSATVGDLHFPGAKLNEFTMMAIDFGNDNSLIQGELLMFATPMSVGTHFLDKTTGKPEDGIVKLYKYGLARGPAKIGMEVTDESAAVIIVPVAGGRGAQVELAYVNNAEYKMGSSYIGTFRVSGTPSELARL